MTALVAAIRRVLVRCNKANPGHRLIPPSGDMVMKWLLEELEAQVTTPTQAQIEAALDAYDKEYGSWGKTIGRRERAMSAALTAAAQVGEQMTMPPYDVIVDATIERCAQRVHVQRFVIGRTEKEITLLDEIEAEIRKLKDEA